MISDKVRRELAKELNEEINIPWVPEGIEESMIYHAIGLVLEVAERYIPLELKELIYNPTEGLEAEGAKFFFNKLIAVVNPQIDIPFMMDSDERKLIDNVLVAIMHQMIAAQ